MFRHGLSSFGLRCKDSIFLSKIGKEAHRVPVNHAKYCADARKVNLTGAKNTYSFDTNRLIKNFQASGFTPEQAEVLTYSLVEITQVQMDFIQKNLITKEHQEILLQQVLSQISMIRKDMLILEKSEFSNLKHEYEKLSYEIGQIKMGFKEEMGSVKADVKLDLNLEKSRAKDAHNLSEKSISTLENRISIITSEHDKQISGLDNKMQTETAKLLAIYERYRNDIFKYAGATVMTCLTICLGFYRLWMN